MSYVVFWLEEVVDFAPTWAPRCKGFPSDEMGAALKWMENLRKDGMRHVTMSSENPNSVGKPGVDSIVDGKTPDGHAYTWMKRRNQ
jgi:hypothetical protein